MKEDNKKFLKDYFHVDVDKYNDEELTVVLDVIDQKVDELLKQKAEELIELEKQIENN